MVNRELLLTLLLGATQASYERIAGYEPSTNVVPHSRIDLDMGEIADAMSANDPMEAGKVYAFGGCGNCTVADIQDENAHSCYQKTTNDRKGCSVKGSGSIRTIKGFATSGAAKMAEEKWWPIYKNYWNDPNYADTFVEDALADDTLDDAIRSELVKKGTAYQAVWMYVLHEFEDAIADCIAGDIFDNDHSTPGDAPHAWDEGWAFYAGSLEGTDGGGSGTLLYMLAEKRCSNFGTCVDGTRGNAKVNVDMLQLSEHGRDKILAGKCEDARKDFEKMVDIMTIPLVQGALRYAFKADPENERGSCTSGSCPKSWAEGWAFAAAILPRINYCDSQAALKVRENFDITATAPLKDGYVEVKEALESTYSCLGITCADVGALQDTQGVFEGMEQCVQEKNDDGMGTGAMIGIVIGALIVVGLIGFFIYKNCLNKGNNEKQLVEPIG